MIPNDFDEFCQCLSLRLLADIIYTHHEIGIRNERLFRVGKPDGILPRISPNHVMLGKQIWERIINARRPRGMISVLWVWQMYELSARDVCQS